MKNDLLIHQEARRRKDDAQRKLITKEDIYRL